MKRRTFLQSVPVTIGGMTVTAHASSPLLAALNASLVDTDRVLVVIQLSGGNDGLNTVIPLDQYSSLSLPTIRERILIPEDKVLILSGTQDATGLHPAMASMHELFEAGKMAIIQGVGYEKFNYSHFRATDIMMTGADSTEFLYSGWLGRYLAYEFPNYPVGFPNQDMPDPLGIRVGGNVVLGLQNQSVPMAISISNTNDPLNLTGSLFADPAPQNYLGKELSYIREVQRQTDKFGDSVKGAADKGSNLSQRYPIQNQPGYTLGQQLKIVAKLISGGIKTRIFWLSTGGYDTHSNQVLDTDHLIGTHANLLKGLSDSVGAFMDDVKLLGAEDRVLGMVFSEFGRRIVSNASRGTDHGAAQPMFVFGSKVVPGAVIGNNPVIDPQSKVNSNLPMQYDYRSIYASILGDWFCVPEADLENILLRNYQKLPILDPTNCIPTSVHDRNEKLGENIVYAYPNPFVDRTRIKFEVFGGHALLQIINNEGSVIRVLHDGELPAGKYDLACELEQEPAGIYYVRLQNGPLQQVKNMMKVRD
ncbi:MAG: DUF1501 domain-containing protein [Saprospiraceae bacterium]|nr:DUF1501 domain-containing protein [Saprospiraceae bacterium]